jgi:hypothetical protein
MEATIKNDITWLKQHERLILGVLFLAVVLTLGNRWVNYSAQKAHDEATVAVQRLNDQKAANEKLAEQVALSQAQYQQMQVLVAKQNAEIMAAISARNANLGRQQAVDKTSSSSDLIIRWANLAQTEGISKQDTDNYYRATDDAARATVIQLEQVPVLQANLADNEKRTGNIQGELDKANTVIGGLNSQVTGLKMQATDSDKACKAEVADVKAQARKGKRNWFIAGFVAGFAARIGLTKGV